MGLQHRYDEFYSAAVPRNWCDLENHGWPRNRVEAAASVPGKGRTIVDVGCGDGFTLWLHRRRFSELVGYEYSEHRLALARTNLAGLAFSGHLGSAESLEQIESGSVDRVLCIDTIEHVPDVYAAIEEFRRILRRGGELIINTPNIAFLKKRLLLFAGRFPSTSQSNEGLGSDVLFDGGHLHYFTFRSLQLLIERHGLKATRAIGYGPFGRMHDTLKSLLSPGVQWVARKP